eukprot:3617805-Rhodomonas_salina.2
MLVPGGRELSGGDARERGQGQGAARYPPTRLPAIPYAPARYPPTRMSAIPLRACPLSLYASARYPLRACPLSPDAPARYPPTPARYLPTRLPAIPLRLPAISLRACPLSPYACPLSPDAPARYWLRRKLLSAYARACCAVPGSGLSAGCSQVLSGEAGEEEMGLKEFMESIARFEPQRAGQNV